MWSIEGLKTAWRNRWGSEVQSLREGAFSADAPITTASEDLLGRGDFARALARVLYSHRGSESLVVALRGEWGSGKTSIKNLVVEALTPIGEAKMQVVTFNPWQWGTDDAITRAFFREIAVALGDAERSVFARRRAHEFRRYAKSLESLSGGLKNAGTRASSAAAWLTGIGLFIAGGVVWLEPSARMLATAMLVIAGAVLILSRIIGFLGRDREDDRPLDIARFDLEQRLREMPRNILVVIDDMDRLEDEQIRTVIRHVKANANFPGLTYLLLYQRNVLENAFGGGEDGRQYLEKIVQAAFDVPVVEGERIGRIVLAELEKVTQPLPTDGKFDQKRWGNVWVGGLRHFFKNLRDAKRFIGGAELQFSLHSGKRVLETNLIDTAALEVLRLFEPDVYAAISRSRALITGTTRERREADKELIKATIAAARPEYKEAVQYVVSQLFPIVSWAFGGSWYGSDWEEGWSSERRICSPRYFDRYFSLRLPDGQISDSEFMEFLQQSADRERLILSFAGFEKRDLLPELLERLDEAAVGRKLPLDSADAFLPALFDISETLPDQIGFGKMPFINAWRTASWYLRSEDDATKRGAAFLKALNGSESLAVPATLISLDMDRKEKGEADLLFAADLTEAKKIWVEKFRAALARDPYGMLGNKHLVNFLYRWRDFETVDGPRAWVASVATKPELLGKLLVAFLFEGQSHAFGDYVTSKVLTFQWNAIEPLIDLPVFTEAVKKLAPMLGTPEFEAQERFLKAAAASEAAKAKAGTSSETDAEDTEGDRTEVKFVDETDL
ncbi:MULTISPECIES: KAP family P-loop NTPase fold protein [unclassified Bradyrhizobium]|nr:MULTISPECIES: P-loop NTPase fold protein [unclassified Bradyrhizobium]